MYPVRVILWMVAMAYTYARVKLVVLNPTNRLGRKELNDDHYRSRFTPSKSSRPPRSMSAWLL